MTADAEPLALVIQELRQVAHALAREGQGGHLSKLAEELKVHADRLEHERDPVTFGPISEDLKRLAKLLVPDDSVSARNVAEACLRLHKLSAPAAT